MSFKREGDDISQLGVLRRRRVKELFAEDIPEDEALLTSNGRYACLVCANRPVFDTVLVLSQHRQGKKHQAFMVQFQEKKDELDMLVKQRRQEQYLKDGTTDIKQATASHRGLGCGHKYDPRVKKKFQSQKNRVNLVELPCDKTAGHHSKIPTATEITSLPGVSSTIKPPTAESGTLKKDSLMDNSKNYKASNTAYASPQFNTNEMFREHFLGQKGPFLHEKQLKNIFSGPKTNGFTPVPYKRKSTSSDEYKAKQRKESHHTELENSSQMVCASNMNPPNQPTEELLLKPNCAAKSKQNKPAQQTSQEDEKKLQEKQQLANKYLYYRGGGWKKNWKGEWIKDEDVEFDSDEEPPDLP